MTTTARRGPRSGRGESLDRTDRASSRTPVKTTKGSSQLDVVESSDRNPSAAIGINLGILAVLVGLIEVDFAGIEVVGSSIKYAIQLIVLSTICLGLAVVSKNPSRVNAVAQCLLAGSISAPIVALVLARSW